MTESAGLPGTFFIVWTNLSQLGKLQAGERLLVHGVSSGIGTTAIQLGKAFNATVYVTVDSDKKCEACLKLGADAAINFHTLDFEKVINILSEDGIDVILDMVGGNYFPKNLDPLALEGRLVQIDMHWGRGSEIDLSPY